MRQYLENIYSMLITVYTVCTNFSGVWGAVAAFASNVTKLKNKIDEIELIKEAQETDITGWAMDKKAKKLDIVKKAMVMAGGTKAYGLANANNVLVQEVSYTRSELKNARDTDFITKVRVIFSKAKDNKVALVEYGITDAMITAFDTLIAEYEVMVQDPRTKIAERKSSTQQLDVLMDEAEDIVEIMDGMVEQFAETNPDFYNSYKAARIIVDVGIRHKKPEPPPPTP